MKRVWIALGLALLVFVPSVASAQSEGAVVERGRFDWDIAWVEYDGAQALIVSSTYPDFMCGDAKSISDRWQVVTTPTGAQHYREIGRLFTRVYAGTWDDFIADPHTFICENEPWAEGILSFLYYDNDVTAIAPGANVWGHVLNGTLRDVAGVCRSRMVKVDIVHLWRLAPDADFPACLPDCAQIRVFKGPTVECVGKK